MDKKLVKAFNDQINNELYSAYLYLAMAAYFEGQTLPGFAHWMKVQFKEEQSHAMKMFEFLVDRNVPVELKAIDKPAEDFNSALQVFEDVLKHEKKVTKLINDLYKVAIDVDDKAAEIFLQWFITEQVEEEKNAAYIIDTIKMIEGKAPALIMFDRELARRE